MISQDEQNEFFFIIYFLQKCIEMTQYLLGRKD